MFESFNSRLKPVGLSCGLLCPRALVMPALCYPFFTISLFVQINSKHCVTHFSRRCEKIGEKIGSKKCCEELVPSSHDFF